MAAPKLAEDLIDDHNTRAAEVWDAFRRGKWGSCLQNSVFRLAPLDQRNAFVL